MKTIRTFTISILAVLIGMAIAFVAAGKLSSDMSITANAMAGEKSISTYKTEPIFSTKSTGGMSSGDTMIELTPQIVDKSRLLVKFRLNTHEVRLSRFDLKEITTLEYEGNVLKPIEASRIGGHHSSGKMVFDIGEKIDSFTIRIKGIPKVQERVYAWDAE
jgi:hypothetical protein